MSELREARAITPGELRDMFLDGCRAAVDYWAEVGGHTNHGQLSGLLHSVLCMIDGVSSALPCAIDLTAAPHPDDKAFCQGEGDNWIEPRTVFNDSDMLHELLYARGIWAHRPHGQGGKAS